MTKSRKARRLLACLGDLLRDVLSEAEEMQTLDEEIAWLRRYAEILESRHDGHLAFQWEIEEGARSVLIPRLLLQPLVENAVKHGALQCSRDGKVVVRACIVAKDGEHPARLQCVVEDNGPGMTGNPPGIGRHRASLGAAAPGAQIRRSRPSLHLFLAWNALGGELAAHRRDRRVGARGRPAKARMKNAMLSSRLRVLVVEDELPTRNYLVELLQGSGVAEVVGAVAGLEDARQALQFANLDIDTAFVDVQLVRGDESGLALVRSLAGSPSAPMFVLATAFKEHAIEAFNLGVADYLLKPFTEERVEQCLHRLLSDALPKRRPARTASSRGEAAPWTFSKPTRWAFEASERMASVHDPHGVFDLDLSLSAIEVSLGRAFTRVHRNWLVNSAFIKELGREENETKIFVGSGLGPNQRGLRVPVARERAQSVREMLLQRPPDCAGGEDLPSTDVNGLAWVLSLWFGCGLVPMRRGPPGRWVRCLSIGGCARTASSLWLRQPPR